MSKVMYRIAGGDYERAGAASGSLKEMLKKVGVEPAALRRAMIAAYEAEANVVIHARGGEMRVSLDDGVLDVEVADEGPGIPDIEEAMREGFSTASPAARELGFGAGMGLPNIRKNVDRFEIASTVGCGTTVRFRIWFAAQAGGRVASGGVRVVAEACTGCLRCLRACPTAALRVRGRRPEVLEALCTGCGACIRACEAGALGLADAREAFEELAGAPLVVPAVLLEMFAPRILPAEVVAALRELGFGEVSSTASWEAALREAVWGYAQDGSRRWPVLSPGCPAVVNLIETRFPSLLGLLAPFASPVEAAVSGAAGRDAVAVAACPAQCSVLAAARGRPRAALAPRLLVQALARRAAEGGRGAGVGSAECGVRNAECGRGARTEGPEALRITGLRGVLAALEAAENGRLGDVPVLELWACEEGCFGSPMFRTEPAVARWRWERSGAGEQIASGPVPRAVRRETAFAARRGVRLDDDMARAIEKLGRLDRLIGELPGLDCAVCGAPTCRALAEDVVLGRADVSACPLRKVQEDSP